MPDLVRNCGRIIGITVRKHDAGAFGGEPVRDARLIPEPAR
jgi:hypothetical protein